MFLRCLFPKSQLPQLHHLAPALDDRLDYSSTRHVRHLLHHRVQFYTTSFILDQQQNMASAQPIPETRVISPSPTPTESSSARDSYFTGTTKKRNGRVKSPPSIAESPESSDPESSRARPRSRSPKFSKKDSARKIPKSPPEPIKTDGHLDPSSAGMGSSYWRNLSRSPSPLGLIPLHREWRSFIHRHEIPRKALHVSIGFFTLGLFVSGAQTSAIHPPLLTALIPIFAVDFIRMHYP